MTTAPNNEPTLQDLANKLDRLTLDVEKYNERFGNYQQAMQWVVQMAITLMISATVALVVSALAFLLRR